MDPGSPPAIPYQAYKSKRHSRNGSTSLLTPNVSPPSASRLASPLPPLTPAAELPDKMAPVIRKASTFRHVPMRNSISVVSSSLLRPPVTHARTASLTLTPRQPEQPQLPLGTETHSHITSPPLRPTSPMPPKPPSKVATPTSTTTTTPSISPAPSLATPPMHNSNNRPSAPYRPGFQPKGVYRPRTDEFVAVRKNTSNRGRIERTKLERRLEKLIDLHFSRDTEKLQPPNHRRASSIFDFDLSDLKRMDAGELWKGMLQSPSLQGTKGDIRAAEQRITPWQDDASVSKCPLCSSSFHPLSNRKHHCRLCGQIICSLPVKRPQRPVTCSILFVVDNKTRRIEEVGEGVDYGVRKRRSSTPLQKGKGKEEVLSEDEKFLKGVRICRTCRPILLRQQYQYEVHHVPTIVRLYQVFITLEKEIEDSLPQFQELILSLSHDGQPTKEASAARKRLLEAFSQYDALAKQICHLPSSSGGSAGSQDRVQMAILTRANLFLQKNMFPLQSLPRPGKATPDPRAVKNSPVIDPDSEMAHALQPLLEQEALLESFVEEAKARRKFEDAKTLKANLVEIRTEIDKIFANADNNSTARPADKAGAGR